MEFIFFTFLLNVALGWGFTLYVINNTDWFPRSGAGVLLVIMGGIILFYIAWWVVFGIALGVFIWRQRKGYD